MHSEKVGAFRTNRTEEVGAFRANKTKKRGLYRGTYLFCFNMEVPPFGMNSQQIFLIHARLEIKTNQNNIYVDCDNDLFIFDVISSIYTALLVVKHGTR